MLATLCFAAPQAAACQGPSVDSLKRVMDTATIVFYGELLRRGSNVPNVDSTSSTWLVRLLEPIRLPRAMQRRTTDTLTIVLVMGGDPNPGQHALFYAHGLVIGEGYAIAEVARFSPGVGVASALATWRARTDSAVTAIADDRLRAEVTRAVVVVVARVDTAIERPIALGGARLEHHPSWRDTRLTITVVFKPSTLSVSDNLRAIIPGSRDMFWQDIPRLEVGETRLFLLVDPNRYHATLPGVLPTDRYAVVRAMHILPVADTVRVRSLMAVTSP